MQEGGAVRLSSSSVVLLRTPMLYTTLAVGIPCCSDPWRHPSEEGVSCSERTARNGIEGRVSAVLVIDHSAAFCKKAGVANK